MSKKKTADLRINYDHATLTRHDLHKEPMSQFKVWFEEAQSAEILEPNAMTLATVSADGTPTARIVLLKQFGADGFVFFTNYESAKGQAIAANQAVALVFYWDILHRQVRVTGSAEKVSQAESAAYFHSRPRGSQIGAWTSPQSSVIPSRDVLTERQQRVESDFPAGREIPLPSNWGGYCVTPSTIEFWQGRPSRLHDRFQYIRVDIGWEISRLAP